MNFAAVSDRHGFAGTGRVRLGEAAQEALGRDRLDRCGKVRNGRHGVGRSGLDGHGSAVEASPGTARMLRRGKVRQEWIGSVRVGPARQVHQQKQKARALTRAESN